MSDSIRISQGASPDELLDTLSYYDDSEPSWNERPYFSLIEERRGKQGIHIDTSGRCPQYLSSEAANHDPLLPGPDRISLEQEEQLYSLLRPGRFRVLVSGIGGDELLGGVPTPQPELCDYFVRAQIYQLLRRIVEWSLANRQTFLNLLVSTAKAVGGMYSALEDSPRQMPDWIHSRLRTARIESRRRDVTRRLRIGFSPTSIANESSWWSIMESLPHGSPFSSSP